VAGAEVKQDDAAGGRGQFGEVIAQRRHVGVIVPYEPLEHFCDERVLQTPNRPAGTE
jgi:hypothetical protein